MVLLIAGCTQPVVLDEEGSQDDDPGTEPGGTGRDPGQGPPTPGVLTNGTYPSKGEWSNCDSLSTGVYLPGRPEFPRPPGWMPEETRPAARVIMFGFECDRFSWGDFERPVRMVFESHNSVRAPPACYSDADGIIHYESMNSLWVNDTQVAEFLRDTYGLPVYYSPILLEREALPAGNEYTLSWGEGDTASWFSTTDDIGHAEGLRWDIRYFWHNGTVLGAMDFFFFYSSDKSGDNPALGEMREPMLMSNYGTDYAGLGMWMPDARVEGSIELYKDTACEEPL